LRSELLLDLGEKGVYSSYALARELRPELSSAELLMLVTAIANERKD